MKSSFVGISLLFLILLSVSEGRPSWFKRKWDSFRHHMVPQEVTNVVNEITDSIVSVPIGVNIGTGGIGANIHGVPLPSSYIVTPGSVDRDRKSTRLNSSHIPLSRMPSSA